MNEFPPPRSDGADTARAERLAALARRRSGATSSAGANTATRRPASTHPEQRSADRLAALAARRPAPGSAQAAPTPTGTSRTTTRRRHPAKGARAAALGLSLASTGGLAALFAVTGPTAGAQVQAAQIVSASPSMGSTIAAATTTTPQLAAEPAATPTTLAPAAQTTNPPTTVATPTVVNGGVFHNKWGDVQVQATFAADGSIIDVAALQTPTRDGKSVRINDRAVPRLNSEALTIQSANVDTVSGATYTSTDYRRSLQSAIDAAVDAGIVVATA